MTDIPEDGQLEELTLEVLDYYVSQNTFTKVVKHTEHLALHPFWLSTPKQGVLEELQKMLGKWNAKLKAYVVGFESVTCDSETGAFNEDHQWIHLDILVTFYLYTPVEGQMLTGVVKKKGKQAAICILFNVFSATVFPVDQDELFGWSLGDEIQFEITSFQNRRKGPIIKANSLSFSNNRDLVIVLPENLKKKKKKVVVEEESWE